MNLMQPFRAEVEKISKAVSDTFDFICAKANAIWNIEHDAEGHHTDITATSVTATANSATGATGILQGEGVRAVPLGTPDGVYGYAALLRTGSAAATASVPLVNAGLELATQLAGTPSTRAKWAAIPNPISVLGTGLSMYSLDFTDLSAANGMTAQEVPFKIVYNYNTGDYHVCPDSRTTATGLIVHLGASGTFGANMAKFANLYLTSSVFDENRSIPMGYWQDQAFNAADFSASGGVAWTLTAPDQTLFRYMLVGKTLFIEFQFDTTSVGAGAPALLQFKLPGGFTAAKTTYTGGLIYSDNGAAFTAIGNIITTAASNQVGLQPGALGVGTWTGGAVNNTSVRGKLFLEIQ